jgi:two-component system, response regulator PdtaR
MGKPVILLVDDEAMLRELFAHVLNTEGYTCVPAANGTDAIRLIEADLHKFDLLVTDVKMPGTVDGFQVVERFRARYPNAGVVVISGHLDPKQAEWLTKGRVSVFTKPMRIDELLNAVKVAPPGSSLGSADDANVVPLDRSRAETNRG